jgi:hypothetical protein
VKAKYAMPVVVFLGLGLAALFFPARLQALFALLKSQ